MGRRRCKAMKRTAVKNKTAESQTTKCQTAKKRKAIHKGFRLNKRGSSTVMLAMVFVVFAISVSGAVLACRSLTVKSEVNAFGRVWEKAILSEYDVHLFDDYNIMAYFGDENDVREKLEYYLDYSISNKLDAEIKGISVNLSGYELSDVSNFKKCVKAAFISTAGEELLEARARVKRESSESERYIGNSFVAETLPSNGIDSSIDIGALTDSLKESGAEDTLLEKGTALAAEMTMIKCCFGNHLYSVGEEETFLINEWEYIVKGSLNDEDNFDACKTRIFLIRNALNLAYLATDSEKMTLISSAAAVITPGPGAVLTQAILMELWAAAESKHDLDTLLDDGRIPLMKTYDTWQTSLTGVINGDDVAEKLDDESKKNLAENKAELDEMSKSESIVSEITEGQTYEDYLMFLILATDENVRLLRMMDIIQLNMKLRYYRDFNFEEYMCGVGFSI